MKGHFALCKVVFLNIAKQCKVLWHMKRRTENDKDVKSTIKDHVKYNKISTFRLRTGTIYRYIFFVFS